MKIKILKHQLAFIQSSSEWTGLVAGFGSGKTDALVITAIHNHIKYKELGRKNIHLLIEPTGSMLRDILVPKIENWLNNYNIDYEHKISNNEFHTKYGIFRLRSGENYIRLPGQEVVNSYIDEYDKFSSKKDQEEILDYIVARTRASQENNQKYIVTTPESGRNMELMFPVEGTYENKTLIKACTKDNPFLPPNYIESLKNRFDEIRLKAYLSGEYVNLTKGKAYYQFNNDMIKEFNIQDFSLLNIAFDFNVDPMVATISVERDGKQIVIDEYWRKGSNTYEACNAIADKIFKFRPRQTIDINIYGDASGQARSANSNLSNYQIIEQILKPYARTFRFNIPSSNPNVVDRINIVNNCFEKKIVEIDKKCIHLIEDLKQVNFSPDGRNIDKRSDNNLTHISDALGYLLAYKYPLSIRFNGSTFINGRKV